MKVTPKSIFHWKENPLLPVLIFIVAGKVFFDASNPPSFFVLSGSLTTLLVGALILHSKVHQFFGKDIQFLRTGISFFFFFWIGASISSFQAINRAVDVHSAFEAVIDENYGETSPGKTRALAAIRLIKTENEWQNQTGKVLLMFNQANLNLVNGSIILVNSPFQTFETPTIPGQFDSRRYYNTQGIHYQVFINEGQFSVLPTSQPHWLKGPAQRVRNWMELKIREFLPEQDAYMLSALLLGIRRKIDPELKAAYSAAGITHILAVSGMHVGLIYWFLGLLLSWLNRFKGGQLAFSFILIGLLWFYGFITGLSPSVLRAVTIFTVFQVGTLLKKPPLPINSLCLATLVLMVFDSNIVYDVGYQLSFSAVYGIISFLEPIENWWKPKSRILKNAWNLMGIPVSIAATLGTFPVILFYFHQFPTYFLIANALAVPWSSLLIFGGIGLLVLSPISILAHYMGLALSWGILVLNKFVVIISTLPFSTLTDIYIDLPEVLFIVLALIFLQVYFKTEHIKILNYAMATLFGIVSFHLIFNYLAWNRAKSTIAMRTSKEWLIGNLDGRTASLNRFGIIIPGSISPFEAKAMKEGFHCLSVNENFKFGRLISTNPKNPEQFSAFYVAENKTILILGNYLKIRNPAPQKIKIDYLIARKAGFKSIENALLLYSPTELWVDWNASQVEKSRQWAVFHSIPIRNFRKQRFYKLENQLAVK